VAVENETKKGIEYFYSIILLPLKMWHVLCSIF
jgi:hypothetical protein